MNNINLIQKIYFPKEVLPLASVLSSFVDFILASIVFVGMMLFYQVPIIARMWFIPLIILVQLIFTVAVVLFASALNVFYRDVKYAVGLGVILWMFLTPVIYSTNKIPAEYIHIFMLNPMAGIIDAYRRVLLFDLNPDPTYFGMALCISVALLALGYGYFKKAEKEFADVI